MWCKSFLISKQHFCWFLLKYLEYSHQISPQKSEKYDLTFDTKIRVGLEKIGGWCCGSCQALLNKVSAEECNQKSWLVIFSRMKVYTYVIFDEMQPIWSGLTSVPRFQWFHRATSVSIAQCCPMKSLEVWILCNSHILGSAENFRFCMIW